MIPHIFLSPTGQAMGRWLTAFPNARVAQVAELAANVHAGLVWLCQEGPGLAGALAGLQAVAPGVPVVVLSCQPDPAEAAAAIAAGARGYCHALAAASLLEQVAIVVSHGGMWIGPELLCRMVAATGHALSPRVEPAPGLAQLTERERAVAEAVARGATNKEAARALGITERTVKAHLGAVFAKLGVRDRLQLVLELGRQVQQREPETA